MSEGANHQAVGEVREGQKFDEASLSRWMERNVPGFEGPLMLSQFKGGQSNPTYMLKTKTKDYVLRRKPSGQLLKGAHAIEREARVMDALVRTGFPVPKIFGLCTDESVIGSWFYVMELVEGRIFWDATFSEMPKGDRHLYFEAMNETLARLHSVDPIKVGLSDYGRPVQYVQRQIARWSKQYCEDELAGRNDDMDFLVAWLPENVPLSEESSIVHGDFRVDNMIFDQSEPRVVAILDWELSTLGHPLADFAYHLMMYRVPLGMVGGIFGTDLDQQGLPTEAEYVASYCRHIGRQSIPDLDFYVAFNMFRFAAILHGIRGRIARGNATSTDAVKTASQFETMARLAASQARAIGPAHSR